MKRLLLLLLLACPALSADEGLHQTWKTINSYRATSAVKAVVLGYLGYMSNTIAWESGKKFFSHLQKYNKDKKQEYVENVAMYGVLTGGMGYTGYRLFGYAWKNAKHALSIK